MPAWRSSTSAWSRPATTSTPRRFQVLRRIIIPLVKPGIIAGSILVFIPSLGAYVTPRVLGGGKNMMIGNLIELQFGQGRNWPLGAALSITLMADRHGGAAGLCPQRRQSEMRAWLERASTIRRAARLHDAIAMICFVVLYLPIVMLVVYRLQRRQLDRDLGGLLAALVRRGLEQRQVIDAAIRSLLIAASAAAARDDRGDDGGAGHHAHGAYRGLTLQICLHQPAADGAGDRHRRGAADLLRAVKIVDRLFRPRLPDRRAHRLLHPLRLSADPGAAGRAWT